MLTSKLRGVVWSAFELQRPYPALIRMTLKIERGKMGHGFA